jgi:hypothetical protein
MKDMSQELERLCAAATNDAIRCKLRNLHDVCRTLVMEARQRLSVPAVLRHYKGQVADPAQSLAESTLRNKREKGNPYQRLYRHWERVAETILAARSAPRHENGSIIGEADLRQIEDPVLRHRVILLFAQNRSLHNQLNIIKEAQKDQPIRLGLTGPGSSGGSRSNLVLNEAELESIRDFIDIRKLRAKQLKPTVDDGVSTGDGRTVADPGFLTALEKIVKSYERS